jgi:predicted transcriptional regulator
MDFSQEELTEAVERLVAGLLERAGVTAPPVDALAVAETHLGIPVEWVEPADEDDTGRQRPRRPAGGGIALTADMSPERRQRVAADGIARLLLPEVFHQLGVAPGTESRAFAAHVRGLVAARVLIPSRLLRAALREYKYDVPALHRAFRTASMEAVAARLLDLEEPCVIAVVDDGVVASRRGNRAPAGRKLTAAEQECVRQVTDLDLPHRARAGGWTAWAWPVPGRPFRRILLRAVPDDV